MNDLKDMYNINPKPSKFGVLYKDVDNDNPIPDFLVVEDRYSLIKFVNSKESFCIPKKYVIERKNFYVITNKNKIIMTGCRKGLSKNDSKIIKIFNEKYSDSKDDFSDYDESEEEDDNEYEEEDIQEEEQEEEYDDIEAYY
jgi:hypothetical protein